VTWSLLAVKVGTLNTLGVCTISLQAAVHPLTGPHTNKQQSLLINKLHHEIKTILRKGNENKGNSLHMF
jgi:hypothetical protein